MRCIPKATGMSCSHGLGKAFRRVGVVLSDSKRADSRVRERVAMLRVQGFWVCGGGWQGSRGHPEKSLS